MLDENLLEERLNNFNPKPLVPEIVSKTKDEIEILTIKEDDQNIDLAKTNFLDVLNNAKIKKVSEDTIRKYGVGTCGPRAFYGTTDVHLNLEQRIADFLGVDESIVYSYGFVAISSAIAAYCKRKDTVFVDEENNFPIQHGLAASRSKVITFNHNDAKSFEAKAREVAQQEKGKPSRKFLIIESISWKTGKIAPLHEFLEVAEKYKMRVFLEESYSIGVLGKTGKGLTEHLDIDLKRIDMIFGTLEAALGTIGGFCAGSHTIIEHQRLNGGGYIFSASLPTYLVQACIESINMLEDKPEKLQALAVDFHKFLSEKCKFKVESDPLAPFKVFTIFDDPNRAKEKKVYEFCKNKSIHFILRDEGGLQINLNIAWCNDQKKLQKIFDTLQDALVL